MSKHHIAIITLHADPTSPPGVGHAGGTHAYVGELMVGLALRGHSVTVVTRRHSPRLPQEEQISRGVRLFRIDIGPPGPLDKRRIHDYHTATTEYIHDLLVSVPSRPAVLHSVYWMSGHVAMDLAAKMGLPFVHTVISNGLRRIYTGARADRSERVEVERRVYQAAFRVICVSSAEQRDVVDLYGVAPARAIVVGRLVDWAFLNPAHDEMGEPQPVCRRPDFGGPH